jgi:aminomethyltransferase
VYGAFLNEEGHCLDDAIVYQLGHDNYMAVVNAGMGPAIAEHLKAHAADLKVAIEDITSRVGKLDLQGPLSARALMKILENSRQILEDLEYFTFKGHFEDNPSSLVTLSNGVPLLLSRSGYTGEFGFELFVRRERVVEVWHAILAAGKEFGVIPCGLAARDSLRAGACLPLSHQDIGPWPFINHPWEFALPYNEDSSGFTKQFLGDRILSAREQAEYTHAFVGRDPRKVSTHDSAVVLDEHGAEIGAVLTCVADMAIGMDGGKIFSMASPDKPKDFKPKGLVCGFVRVKSKLFPGQEVELKDNKRKIKVFIANDIRPDRTARRPIREMM